MKPAHRLIEFDRGSGTPCTPSGFDSYSSEKCGRYREPSLSRSLALDGAEMHHPTRSEGFLSRSVYALALGRAETACVPASQVFLIRLDRNFYYPAKIHRALGDNIGYGVTLARYVLAVG